MACCSRSSTGLVCWRRGAGSSPAGRSFLQEQRVNGLKAINSAPSKLGKAKKPKTNTKPKKKTPQGTLWGQLHPIGHIHPNGNGTPKTRGLHGRAGNLFSLTGTTLHSARCLPPHPCLPLPRATGASEAHANRSNPITGYSGPAKVSRWVPICYRATPNIAYATGTPQNCTQPVCALL